MRRGKQPTSGVHEFPSVASTMKFLALCEQYGAERLAVRIVAAGRSAGVAGLPESNDWTTWDADERPRSSTCSASEAAEATAMIDYEGPNLKPRRPGEQEPRHGSPNGSFRTSVGTGSSHTETTGMSPANLRIPASLE